MSCPSDGDIDGGGTVYVEELLSLFMAHVLFDHSTAMHHCQSPFHLQAGEALLGVEEGTYVPCLNFKSGSFTF